MRPTPRAVLAVALVTGSLAGVTRAAAPVARQTAPNAAQDISSLPVELTAAPVAPSATGMQTVVTARVTYPDGTPAAFEDQLHITLVAVDSTAATKAQHAFTVPVHHEAAASGPFSVVMDDLLDLPVARLTLRLSVASTTEQATGTAHVDVVVPTVEGDGPTIGGLLIGIAASAPEAYGWEAIQSLVPFQPVTGRMFATTDTLRVFAKTYWKTTGSSDAGAQAVIRILDGETNQTETLTGNPSGPNRAGATVDATVPLTGLTPGTHALQVEVRRAGRPPADSRVIFDIR